MAAEMALSSPSMTVSMVDRKVVKVARGVRKLSGIGGGSGAATVSLVDAVEPVPGNPDCAATGIEYAAHRATTSSQFARKFWTDQPRRTACVPVRPLLDDVMVCGESDFVVPAASL